MKVGKIKWSLAVVILAAGAFSLSGAVESAKQSQAEMDAQMQKAMQLGSPGEQHKVLEPLAGKWIYTSRMWMKPGDKAQETKGTADHNWVFGNRFLRANVKGEFNGQPFEGLGYTGYDNVRGEYQSTWMDSMMTGIMKMTGEYDPKTKTLTQSGTFGCPLTGEKEMWYRSEWKILGNDKNTYTSYGKGPDGKEFKSMEIVYTRVGGSGPQN